VIRADNLNAKFCLNFFGRLIMAKIACELILVYDMTSLITRMTVTYAYA